MLQKHNFVRSLPSGLIERFPPLTSRAVSDEPLITTGEVARRLGVTTSAIGGWVQRGQLTPAIITPGGRYRWRWSQVEHQLREQRQRDE